MAVRITEKWVAREREWRHSHPSEAYYPVWCRACHRRLLDEQACTAVRCKCGAAMFIDRYGVTQEMHAERRPRPAR